MIRAGKNMIDSKKEKHKTVLLEEAVDALQIKKGDIIVDATLGAGGHTLKILDKVGEKGKVIVFDLDKQAISEFKEELKDKFPIFVKRIILVNDNFKNINRIIKNLYSIEVLNKIKITGILADLGWRIEQIRDKRYGMSFQKKMSLDMRMSPETQKITAQDIINDWSAEELNNIFKELGDEKYAHKISLAIVKKRKKGKIKTTTELADLVILVKRKNFRQENRPASIRQINPATKVFQALRITVNEELSNLNIFLEESLNLLENKGRLVIISFHSLEDRLVKNFFRAKARGCVCPKEMPVCVCDKKKELKIIKKKVIKESKEILQKNIRARSARMRIAEKI